MVLVGPCSQQLGATWALRTLVGAFEDSRVLGEQSCFLSCGGQTRACV